MTEITKEGLIPPELMLTAEAITDSTEYDITIINQGSPAGVVFERENPVTIIGGVDGSAKSEIEFGGGHTIQLNDSDSGRNGDPVIIVPPCKNVISYSVTKERNQADTNLYILE